MFWRDGFEPLAALDDNRDGKLTGSEIWGIGVWRDANATASPNLAKWFLTNNSASPKLTFTAAGSICAMGRSYRCSTGSRKAATNARIKG